MNAEDAFADMLAPYRAAARDRLATGRAIPESEHALRPITEGTFVTYNMTEDVDGDPWGAERHVESLGFTDSRD